MIRLLTVVLALLAGSVFADEPFIIDGFNGPITMPRTEIKPGTFKRGRMIVVTDNIPPELLPSFVKNFTADEFKAWATAQNAAAYTAASQRHTDYLANRGPLNTADFAESSASHTTRFGGGVGAGGFGGAGGYLGYSNNSVSYPFGYGPGYGNGANGLGTGFSFNGNTIRTNDSSFSKSYTTTYPDLNDGGGGPVFIINPFCFDYWRQHTE